MLALLQMCVIKFQVIIGNIRLFEILSRKMHSHIFYVGFQRCIFFPLVKYKKDL